MRRHACNAVSTTPSHSYRRMQTAGRLFQSRRGAELAIFGPPPAINHPRYETSASSPAILAMRYIAPSTRCSQLALPRSAAQTDRTVRVTAGRVAIGRSMEQAFAFHSLCGSRVSSKSQTVKSRRHAVAPRYRTNLICPTWAAVIHSTPRFSYPRIGLIRTAPCRPSPSAGLA